MRILVVRPDAIGDVVLMVPLLNTIRRTYPDAEIYTIQQPYTVPLLQDHPAVTAIIPDWKKMGKAGMGTGFLAYANYIKSFGFDVAFFPYLEPYYIFLATIAGIPVRVGDSNKVVLNLFLTHSIPLNFRNLLLHEVEQSAKLIWAIHPEVPLDLTMDLVISDRDVSDAQELLVSVGADPDRPYIVIHPRSGGGNRPWLPEKYSKLIDFLTEQSQFQILLTGAGPVEVQMISDIRFATSSEFFDLSGKTPLRTLMGLISGAKVVIGTDTGPTHIAAALSIPVISISPTKFVKSLRWGPWRTRNRVVSQSHECNLICRPYQCSKSNCLDAIDVVRVGNSVLNVGNDPLPMIPTKHAWLQTSMHMMVYWSGNDDQLDNVVALYGVLKESGFVVHLATCSGRFRRHLSEQLLIDPKLVAIVPPFDWVSMVRTLSRRDITAVFVVGPMIGWFWFVIRQLCALWQYCPPISIPFNRDIRSTEDVFLSVIRAIYK